MADVKGSIGISRGMFVAGIVVAVLSLTSFEVSTI
jgi:hypothetical protein